MIESHKNTVKEEEISQFQKDSTQWWDEDGAFAPLHKLNPVRIKFIRSEIIKHYQRDPSKQLALKDLDILDIGCGGGLVCEPLTRLGGNVTGIDADSQAINVAIRHAEKQGLAITYKSTTSEELSQKKKKYDVVCALEIIEHVENPEFFIKTCVECLKPDGILLISTLNRTPKSFLMGIVAAEHLLRWVPKGTHHWSQFVKPSEIRGFLHHTEFKIRAINGINYNILKGKFNLSDEGISNNYILSAARTHSGK